MHPLPSFDELPNIPGNGPIPGCAWIWGKDDNLGTLNILTPDRVMTAREEIKAGRSCALNWEMTKNLKFPPTFRCSTTLNVKDTSPSGTTSFDDEIHFNPQSGSQLDGLRHYAHQESQTYYNDLKHKDIVAGIAGTRNSISEISKRGGIVGRGVLLDYKRWADRRGISYSPISRHVITIAELEGMAAEQGVELREGDILIIRSGFVLWHENAPDEERRRGTQTGPGTYVGVEAGTDAAAWLWNHHFAMVAGDTMAFEAWPPTPGEMALHEYMISMWGMPIGELWDLEQLAEMCEQEQRWSFFFTSAPLNVEGGISSPPNALCIF
ncbi:putative cyclase-domain-containing protein [Xylariales sp. PMI_506]|nr:putative cyclase-domain-containing protein [Xylariales sp. PMI_506]